MVFKKGQKPPVGDDKEFKFGISDLAKALNLEPATVRKTLRDRGVERAGKSYGWDTQKELDAVVAKCKAGGGDKKDAKPKVKAAGTDKASTKRAAPVAKAKVKKAA